ncbi:hypothetical protein T492DRAFT_1096550 [Pavlovales sp. CCMP2436]|nr:hypothetical protein T492DRAFT_1096550 [Pavlovales sp. CCMP2436]
MQALVSRTAAMALATERSATEAAAEAEEADETLRLLRTRLEEAGFVVHASEVDASAAPSALEPCAREIAAGRFGEGEGARLKVPISAQALPERYAFVRAPPADGARGADREIECVVFASGDSNPSWRELEALCTLAAECAQAAGVRVRVRDVPAHELPFHSAREYALCATAPNGGEVVVARCASHVDFIARARGWRQAVARVRDRRTPDARFIHTLTLSFDVHTLALRALATVQPASQ